MFEDDVAKLREMYDAFNRADPAAARESFDPEIVWETDLEDPDAQNYRGRDEVYEHLERIREVFGEYRIVPEQFIDAGDGHVLVRTLQDIRGTASGAQIQVRRYHLWTMRDGRAGRFRTFGDEAAAKRAAGLDPG